MRTIAILISLISIKLFACGAHPGISHEAWTSAVRDERDKKGAVVTLSDGFFSGGVGAQDSNQGYDDRGSRNPTEGRRPVDDSRRR